MFTEYDKRMKEYYEKRAQTSLTRRIPVIIRVDGRAFHSFCRRFDKPFSKTLNFYLNETMNYLCKNIQGCKFAQRHSDEISLLLTDYDTLQTDAFFDYDIQKICSIVASMATGEFCRQMLTSNFSSADLKPDEEWPSFDCRCFNIPENEITNYFWWRMLDATRGSINMLGQSLFSHEELQGKSCEQVQEMLFQQHKINWNDLSQGQKTGFICVRTKEPKPIEKGPKAGEVVIRSVWQVKEGVKTRNELQKIIDSIEFSKKE
jgi:tRNA(His) guanylyltransferase